MYILMNCSVFSIKLQEAKRKEPPCLLFKIFCIIYKKQITKNHSPERGEEPVGKSKKYTKSLSIKSPVSSIAQNKNI